MEDNDQEKTEEPTPEKRDEFREEGQIAHSKELSSVAVLFAATIFLTFYIPNMVTHLVKFTTSHFEKVATTEISPKNIITIGNAIWGEVLLLILPFLIVAAGVGAFVTLLQTRFNFSGKKLAPDFSRMNPVKGLARMFSFNVIFELMKDFAKLGVVGLVAYLVLYSEIKVAPGLINLPTTAIWGYWAQITKSLFIYICGLLLVIAGTDYFYNWITLENKMKMSRQEIKEEYKRREIDPQLKGRMRRFQRDLISRKTIEATKTATVLITNPTHYAIALKYGVGMSAPILVAKGVDFVALKMREICKEADIIIVENKLLARTLYRLVEIDQEIPESLYKAVSEVIKYVMRIKGVGILQKSTEQKN